MRPYAVRKAYFLIYSNRPSGKTSPRRTKYAIKPPIQYSGKNALAEPTTKRRQKFLAETRTI